MAKIDSFFKYLKEKNASDLHLTVGHFPMIRIKDELATIQWQEITEEINRQFIFEILSEKQKKEFEAKGDLNFSYEPAGLESRFRGTIYKDSRGIGACFRMVRQTIIPYDDLGLPEIAESFLEEGSGLVLVAGAPGGGKTTTLAAMVDRINENRINHITTIESPIEYRYEPKKALINQREVGTHTVGYASGIKSSLLQDVDVLVIGNLRDADAVDLALSAAESGRLVLAAVESSSAAKAIGRILYSYPTHQQEYARALLSDNLRGVIAVQLCDLADGRGQIMAAEVLVANYAVSALIRDGKILQIPSILQTGRKEGMQSMDQALLQMMKTQVVSPQEAYIRAFDKKTFLNYLPQLSDEDEDYDSGDADEPVSLPAPTSLEELSMPEAPPHEETPPPPPPPPAEAAPPSPPVEPVGEEPPAEEPPPPPPLQQAPVESEIAAEVLDAPSPDPPAKPGE